MFCVTSVTSTTLMNVAIIIGTITNIASSSVDSLIIYFLHLFCLDYYLISP